MNIQQNSISSNSNDLLLFLDYHSQNQLSNFPSNSNIIKSNENLINDKIGKNKSLNKPYSKKK